VRFSFFALASLLFASLASTATLEEVASFPNQQVTGVTDSRDDLWVRSI
jgi:hypothetical protein